MNEWITEFPTEEGWWWFYGHRYGVNGIGELSSAPELCAVKVVAVRSGFMWVADGQFMYESEVLYPHFKKMNCVPSFPKIQSQDEHESI
jgi:hypothetical protein